MNPAKRLWKDRLAAHTRLVARYTFYAGQSGFFLFLFVAFIVSSYLYGRTLERIPDDFPYAVVLACWLAPFMAVSPIRTLLKEADLVFLLPMEARMGAYFRGALLYSFVTQGFAAVFAVSAGMPLYRHGSGSEALPYVALVLFALALKFANLLGGWTESSFVRAGNRASFRAARWLADFIVLYSLYRYGFVAGGIAFVAAFALMGGWSLRSRKLPVNWPYLRLKEASHRTTLLLFFNWFVDVDDLPNRVKPRRLLSRLANLLPLRKDNAFRYLYALTLLRSELFGIMTRLTLLALIILLAVKGTWLFAGVYALFLVVTHVQLSALVRFHRHSVWPALYPIPAAQRPAAAARVALAAQLAQAALLALPMFRPDVFAPWLPALPLIGGAAAFAFRSRGGRSAKDKR
ncbi:ABC transporter permease [Paenibacillus sp. GYB003]|uniref:ABC transporter permease n=1 Tax=Paenibacillus sp. GYB003 TaxID=2994392 RepID=UPI002F962BEC